MEVEINNLWEKMFGSFVSENFDQSNNQRGEKGFRKYSWYPFQIFQIFTIVVDKLLFTV